MLLSAVFPEGLREMPSRSKWQSLPTEQINPATLAIDKLDPVDIVEGMINEDRKMLAAVGREKERIAVGIEIITQSLRKGGRVVFVGAGTSGRLGVLESAEMPPTFGTSPLLVQAIMAGGQSAVLKAREGVEDNYEEGARSINRLRPKKHDVVVGVSASGMTQFVRGALTRARKAGSKIIFVTCDPRTELQTFVDLTIAPAVGPEVIAGSTRLKAGTATKMVLNMLTTASMIRIGKTYGNLMVDVQMGSEKLKDRARRIITIVTGLEYRRCRHAAAKSALERQGGDRHAEGRPQLHAVAVAAASRPRLRQGRDRRRRRGASEGTAQSRLAAARSSHTSAPRCNWRNEAGRRGVTGPRNIRSTQRAFSAPVASSTIRRE